jgi:hypothetical protein
MRLKFETWCCGSRERTHGGLPTDCPRIEGPWHHRVSDDRRRRDSEPLVSDRRASADTSWREFVRAHRQIFTVETIWLQRLYVLFFIELGSRRVHVAGCTPNPSATWVVGQARQLSWALAERSEPMRF